MFTKETTFKLIIKWAISTIYFVYVYVTYTYCVGVSTPMES